MILSWLLPKKKFKLLTGNLIKGEAGRYIGYFNEFPEVIAQGKTEEETKERLLRGLVSILERKKKESISNQQDINGGEVRHFELSAAMKFI